jgi:hypothetical protein
MRSHSTLIAALIIALVALTTPLFVGLFFGGGHTAIVTTVAVLAFAVVIGSRRWFHRR